MQYREGNTYRGEVPSSWLMSEGSYRLRIGDTRVVEIRFEVSKSNRSLYIGAGISSVGPSIQPVHFSAPHCIMHSHARVIVCECVGVRA